MGNEAKSSIEKHWLRLTARALTMLMIIMCVCTAGLAFLLAWAGSMADTSPRENHEALLVGGGAGIGLIVIAVGLGCAMVGRAARSWSLVVIGVSAIVLSPLILLSSSLQFGVWGTVVLWALPLLCIADGALLYVTAERHAPEVGTTDPSGWTSALQVASGFATLATVINGVAFMMAGVVFSLDIGGVGWASTAGVIGASAHVVLAIAMIVALQLRRPMSRGATWVVLIVSAAAISAVGTIAAHHGTEAMILGAVPALNVLCGLGLLRAPLQVHPLSGRCRSCGYSLEGLAVATVCPECGKAVG